MCKHLGLTDNAAHDIQVYTHACMWTHEVCARIFVYLFPRFVYLFFQYAIRSYGVVEGTESKHVFSIRSTRSCGSPFDSIRPHLPRGNDCCRKTKTLYVVVRPCAEVLHTHKPRHARAKGSVWCVSRGGTRYRNNFNL